MAVYIKYTHGPNNEVFYEDQTGCSRSMVDIQLRAQEMEGKVVELDDDNVCKDGIAFRLSPNGRI